MYNKKISAKHVVTVDAHGGAIPKRNNVAPGIVVHNINANGILIANAENMLFAAANTVFEHPKKNPFRQNTNGTIR